MAKGPRIYRDYSIKRDAQGMPIAMYWNGDYILPDTPAKETQQEIDKRRLEEWEATYGTGK